jgi:hypothetical protein
MGIVHMYLAFEKKSFRSNKKVVKRKPRKKFFMSFRIFLFYPKCKQIIFFLNFFLNSFASRQKIAPKF